MSKRIEEVLSSIPPSSIAESTRTSSGNTSATASATSSKASATASSTSSKPSNTPHTSTPHTPHTAAPSVQQLPMLVLTLETDCFYNFFIENPIDSNSTNSQPSDNPSIFESVLQQCTSKPKTPYSVLPALKTLLSNTTGYQVKLTINLPDGMTPINSPIIPSNHRWLIRQVSGPLSTGPGILESLMNRTSHGLLRSDLSRLMMPSNHSSHNSSPTMGVYAYCQLIKGIMDMFNENVQLLDDVIDGIHGKITSFTLGSLSLNPTNNREETKTSNSSDASTDRTNGNELINAFYNQASLRLLVRLMIRAIPIAELSLTGAPQGMPRIPDCLLHDFHLATKSFIFAARSALDEAGMVLPEKLMIEFADKQCTLNGARAPQNELKIGQGFLSTLSTSILGMVSTSDGVVTLAKSLEVASIDALVIPQLLSHIMGQGVPSAKRAVVECVLRYSLERWNCLTAAVIFNRTELYEHLLTISMSDKLSSLFSGTSDNSSNSPNHSSGNTSSNSHSASSSHSASHSLGADKVSQLCAQLAPSFDGLVRGNGIPMVADEGGKKVMSSEEMALSSVLSDSIQSNYCFLRDYAFESSVTCYMNIFRITRLLCITSGHRKEESQVSRGTSDR